MTSLLTAMERADYTRRSAGYCSDELTLAAGDDPAQETDPGTMLAAECARGALVGGAGPKLDAVKRCVWWK